jgi:hypothetical protein
VDETIIVKDNGMQLFLYMYALVAWCVATAMVGAAAQYNVLMIGVVRGCYSVV